MKHFLPFAVFLFAINIGMYSTNGVAESPYHAKRIYNIPVIDGVPDDPCWDTAAWAPIDQIWIGTPTTPGDYTGSYKIVWTPERLYILMKFIRQEINDTYPAGTCTDGMYNYDCAEIFIDENHSQDYYLNTYKAFAYHLMDNGNVCAVGPSGWEDHKNDMKFKFDSAGNNTYYWEVELKVLADNYVYGGNNIPVTLTGGKQIGLSLAYNTNDGGTTRKNMFGSHYISDPSHRNDSYMNALYLGDLFLDGDTTHTAIHHATLKEQFRCYPNPLTGEVNIYLAGKDDGRINLQLFDILGKEVKKMSFNKSQNILNEKINLSGLPKGIYILKVGNGQKQYINKLTVH